MLTCKIPQGSSFSAAQELYVDALGNWSDSVICSSAINMKLMHSSTYPLPHMHVP